MEYRLILGYELRSVKYDDEKVVRSSIGSGHGIGIAAYLLGKPTGVFPVFGMRTRVQISEGNMDKFFTDSVDFL